jgi:hypothetical protein
MVCGGIESLALILGASGMVRFHPSRVDYSKFVVNLDAAFNPIRNPISISRC